MCGIVGFTGKENKKKLIRLLKTVKHRGYDDTALYCSSGVNLGMNRFAIIDLSRNLYPINYKNYILFYNGEIYNYQKLKTKLQALGVSFKTNSDAEVILPLFDIYGFRSLSMLEGMFAICIFDKKNSKLILARDKFGEKPLYYYKKDKTIIFASEIKTIMASLPKKYLNQNSLLQYLTDGSITGSETLIRDVYKVEPSQYNVFDLKNGKTFSKRYWSPRLVKPLNKNNQKDLEKKLIHLIGESVKGRLRADVPVGCFLSGGVDSSLVAYFASQKITNLKTFSISFPRLFRYDESWFARKMSNFLKTDHIEVACTPEKCRTLIKNIGKLIDEPVVDPAFLPTLLLAKEARRHVKVVLTGLGADEVFGGYYRYHKVLIKIFLRKIHLYKNHFNYSPQNIWTKKEMSLLLSYTPNQNLVNLSLEKSISNPLKAMQMVDFRGYLAEQVLMMVDKSTMLNNLEARSPFLDSKIIEFALSLPSNLLINGFSGKYILKKVAEKFIPKVVAWRPKKGFSLPLNNWFRNELKDEAMLSLSKMKKYDAVFEIETYKRIISEHMSGQANHGNKIFSIVVLMNWLDYYKIEIFRKSFLKA